ncbi:MAG: hypothetical protein KC708_23475 [Anaerolineae bacterium]|nr:hypothetical protein [Anaerolineae bacterium]
MNGFFYLIDRVAIGFYIIIGAVVVWQMRKFLLAQSEYRSTYFELERDLARVQQGAALTAAIIALEFAFAIIGVQRVIVPFLQTEEDLQVELANMPSDGDFLTATPAPINDENFDIQAIELPDDADSNIILLTPTLTPTPVGTIIPNAPAIEGCDSEQAMLQVPANGMRVFQPMIVIGQAFADDFSSAKIELSGPSTNDQYIVVGEIFSPVPTLQAFSEFNPFRYSTGEYAFRLVVFDASNEIVAACKVTIYISEAPITATPTPLPEGGSAPVLQSTATPSS